MKDEIFDIDNFRIIILCVIVVILSLMLYTFILKNYQIHVIFSAVEKLQVGSPVIYKELHIGRVSKITLQSPNKIMVTLKINSNQKQVVKHNALFTISKGLFSDKTPKVLLGYCRGEDIDHLQNLKSGEIIPGEDNELFFTLKTEIGCPEQILKKIGEYAVQVGKEVFDSPEMKQLTESLTALLIEIGKLSKDEARQFIQKNAAEIKKIIELLRNEAELYRKDEGEKIKRELKQNIKS